jgi:hypothetical protein
LSEAEVDRALGHLELPEVERRHVLDTIRRVASPIEGARSAR